MRHWSKPVAAPTRIISLGGKATAYQSRLLLITEPGADGRTGSERAETGGLFRRRQAGERGWAPRELKHVSLAEEPSHARPDSCAGRKVNWIERWLVRRGAG